MALQIIHIVLGKANPNRMNGVNKVVNSLATHQAALGYYVSIWGITKSLEINYPLRNYNTILFYDRSKFLIDKKWKFELKQLDKNTIFHIHGGFIPQFYRIAKLLRKYGFEYFLTPHGAYNNVALERSATKKKIYIQLFEKWLVKNAKKLHFIGASEVKNAENVFNKIPFCLVPNGQEISKEETESISQNKNDHPIFGFIGRLDLHTKGLDLLLKGFEKYTSEANDSAELWLIGDGPDREELVSLTHRLGIDNQIKFLGPLFGVEKTKCLQQMNYLCLTSRNEGLPGVVLEAAAQGIPSIVSPETNMGAYLRKYNAGICLYQNNISEISKALLEATKTNYPKINLMQMLHHEFDWKTISKQLIKEYES
ncbi:MAG: glycosyltransferase involved in cell wall biosynthesis [Parvicella sp.]|jgi:glycosyltransferase involved in cell wall biosynthesis